MSTTRYSIFPSTVHTTELQQVLAVEVSPGSSKEPIQPGGALDIGALPLNFAAPSVVVRSHDFTTIIGAISISAGLSCSSGATFRYQRRANSGTFSGSTTNVTVSSTKGFAILDSLSARQDTPAEVATRYVALYDGSTQPLVINTSVDLSGASQPAFTSVFYLGPLYVNSTQIEGVTGVTVNPGVILDGIRADGDLFARECSIVARMPSITFTLRKLDYLGTIADLFNANPSTTVKWYLQKGAHGTAARVSAGSSVHVKVSSTSGAWSPDNISVQGTPDGEVAITYTPTTTLACVVNSAIP